jgi:hypothetical protein
MALWTELILSGSAARLASLQLDTALGVGSGGTGLTATSASAFIVGTGVATFTLIGSNGVGRVLREDGAQAVNMSGSFSGSFIGSGAGLTGVTADSTYPISGSSGGFTFSTATDTLAFITASVHGFDLSSSFNGTRKSIYLVTPQDLRTQAGPSFTGITASGTTFNLVNATATTINFGGAATTMNIGNAAGTVTFGNNVVIPGDLTVLGNTTVLDVTNLLVEDRFILLNSGSATGDGGFIVQSGSAFNGVAFGWDESAARWGVQQNTLLTHSSSVLAPEAYMGVIVDVDAGMTDSITYQKTGNIRISGSKAYIWI